MGSGVYVCAFVCAVCVCGGGGGSHLGSCRDRSDGEGCMYALTSPIHKVQRDVEAATAVVSHGHECGAQRHLNRHGLDGVCAQEPDSPCEWWGASGELKSGIMLRVGPVDLGYATGRWSRLSPPTRRPSHTDDGSGCEVVTAVDAPQSEEHMT